MKALDSSSSQRLTCGEDLLQVQDSVDQRVCVVGSAGAPVDGGQQRPRQDAAGTCRTERKRRTASSSCPADWDELWTTNIVFPGLTQSRSGRQLRPAVYLHAAPPPLHQLMPQRIVGVQRHQAAADAHGLQQSSCNTHTSEPSRPRPSGTSKRPAPYPGRGAGSSPSCRPASHTPSPW